MLAGGRGELEANGRYAVQDRLTSPLSTIRLLVSYKRPLGTAGRGIGCREVPLTPRGEIGH